MTVAHDAILSKIRALQALAADARNRGSLHEAEAAAMRADEMIQRYRLDSTTIDLPQGEPSEAIGTETLDESPRQVSWRSSLAVVLARNYGCKVYVDRKWAPTPGRRSAIVSCVQLVGFPSDVAVVRHMFAWLTVEISRLAVLRNRGRSARHAFCLGAVRGFAGVLAESKRKATAAYEREHGGSAAMVLRDRAAEVSTYVDQTVGKLRSGGATTFRDRGAYDRGHAAGARLSVNHAPALGGGRKALPGG